MICGWKTLSASIYSQPPQRTGTALRSQTNLGPSAGPSPY